MGDLIRRSDAIEEIARRDTTDGTVKVFSGREVADILHNLPSAYPEQKTGEWILTDFPDEQTYKCSSCNEHWTFLEGTPYDNGAYFCPNCGADMRGEEE